MFSEILSIFADLITILVVWTNKDYSTGVKIALTGACILISAVVFWINRRPYGAKVIDYCREQNKVKHVFIKKNSNFTANSLVSLYYHQHGQRHLAAIGFVLDNNTNEFQVTLVKIFGDYLSHICASKKGYKDFVVTPVMMYNETESLFLSGIEKEGD